MHPRALGRPRRSTIAPYRSVRTTSAPPRKAHRPPSPTSSDGNGHRRKWQLLPDPEDGDAESAAVAERRHSRQLGLLAFYAPQTSSEARIQLKNKEEARKHRTVEQWVASIPSPQLDELLDDLYSPTTLAAWLQALGARLITVPGTGGCLYLAIHASRARKITVNHDKMLTLCQHNIHEATSYKKDVCNAFLDYLEPMVAAGTITLADLNRRYFGLGPPQDGASALKAIREFILGIRQADVKRMTRGQWGGDEELFALAWYVREPIFVISEAQNRTTSVRVIRLNRPQPHGPENIVEQFPSVSEAHAILRLILRYRVLPTIMVFSTAVNGDGHFNSLRLADHLYIDWMEGDPDGAAMHDRRGEALCSLGWYVPPKTHIGIPRQTEQLARQHGDEDSDYKPSYSLSPSEEAPSAPTPVAPHLFFTLHRALNPRGRRRSALASVWHQAELLNYLAYREWDSDQVGPDARSDADTFEAGCRYWSRSTAQLVALLRALPYPEVAMSLLPATLLDRLGRELRDAALDPPQVPPDFVQADNVTNAAAEWSKLVATLIVISSVPLEDANPTAFLHTHRAEALDALHALRLHDWTIISRLARLYDNSI